MSVDLNSMAQMAAEKSKPSDTQAPASKSIPVVVSFRNPNPDLPKLLAEKIELPDPVVVSNQYSSHLGFIADNDQVASHFVDKIESFRRQYSEVFLDQLDVPTNPGWLEVYMSHKDFGIDYVSTSMAVNAENKETLVRELEDLRDRKTDREHYLYEVRRDQEQASEMTFDRMADDLSSFIIGNFEDFPSDRRVKDAVTKLLHVLLGQAKGKDFVSEHHAQEVEFALSDICDHQRPKGEAGPFKLESELSRMFRGQHKVQSQLYEDGSAFAQKLLRRKLPDLSMEGLNRMLNDDESGPVPLKEEFRGLSVSGTRTFPFEQRLTPGSLRYNIQEQGSNLHHEIGAAIVAYTYDVLQNAHEHNHQKALREFSRDIQGKEYYEHAKRLIAESRPSLANGPAMNHDGPSLP